MDYVSSSSTSSESSASSLSSSASSSGTESSSKEEKRENVKTQATMNTRRKSSEVKNFEKQMVATTTTNAKRQTNSTTSVNRVLRKNQPSSDEESPSNKKLSNDATLQKRKPSTSTPTNQIQHLTQNGNDLNSKICQVNQKQNKEQKILAKKSKLKSRKSESDSNKLVTKKQKVTKNKQIIAKGNLTKNNASTNSFLESGSASVSESENESTTSSDTEATASSNSFTSMPAKIQKCKKDCANNKIVHVESEDDNAPRKLTRSLSTRVTKQPKREISATETSTDPEDENSTKKNSNSIIANKKWKKDNISSNAVPNCTLQQGCMSPPCQQEKKCPIEGCDSSGHLSGLLERHFLQEACPIYHNMSASECKEAANERKVQNEKFIKKEKDLTNTNSSQMNIQLTDQHKEFLAKINDSRSKFKPLLSSINDKVKLEKDCTDEDREPNLIGFVPEYDFKLFREAQAIASQKVENEVKDLQVGKGIKYITMGKYKMKVWYQSPYPEDAARLPQMYICEFCLRYQKSETSIKRHAQKCVWRHPPGDEIYRKGKLQVWQVDGKRHKQYCQHLCLLAKFFLDHKTLYYDVEPFLFYIMTLADIDGCHTVGYFSKEKNSFYNVSCILTLPPYQRKGYGRLLIDFSYLLTRVEGKIGSPEKPLSDLGLISYRSYWKDVLLDFLCNRNDNTLSIKDVSQEMAIYSYDIVSTLQALGMMKYWKGKHIVLKKQDVLDEYAERVKRRGSFPKIDESCLRWNPFVQSHSSDSP